MKKNNILQLQNDLYKIIDNKEYNAAKNIIEKSIEDYSVSLSVYDEKVKPTFDDIRQTHFLFINNQYKPFIEAAFSYSSASINTKPLFNGEATFEVPIDGTFVSDMVLHVQLSELVPVLKKYLCQIFPPKKWPDRSFTVITWELY